MCNTAALSRLPLPIHPTNVPMQPETITLLAQLASVPLTATQIHKSYSSYKCSHATRDYYITCTISQCSTDSHSDSQDDRSQLMDLIH